MTDLPLEKLVHNGVTYDLKDASASEAIANLADVATSGDYEDLTNKPELATVATSGDYEDLINKPEFEQVNADWDADSGAAQILNKPALATVATSGDYEDLTNKPEFEQVNADWNADSGAARILNKPTLATVATSGDYEDLINKPNIPTDTGDLTNNAGYIKSDSLNNYATKSELNAKQDNLSEAQLNAVNSGITTALVTKIDTNEDAIDGINAKIPNQATYQNQLADKDFVNSSVSTNTAYFIGTFNSLEDLNAYSGTVTNNDYAFVVGTDSSGNTVYNRYKYNGSAWIFEYALNNSSFTANQWASINSGITVGLVNQINTNTSDIAGKQDTLISGETIKTLSGKDILGEGDLNIVSDCIPISDSIGHKYDGNTDEWQLEATALRDQNLQNGLSNYVKIWSGENQDFVKGVESYDLGAITVTDEEGEGEGEIIFFDASGMAVSENGVLMAVSRDKNYAVYSRNDGQTWRKIEYDERSTGTNLTSIHYIPETHQFMAIGDNKLVVFGGDGDSYSHIYTLPENVSLYPFSHILFANDTYVFASGGKVFSTTDLEHWSTSDISNYISDAGDIAYYADHFIVVGRSSSAVVGFKSLSNWTEVTLPNTVGFSKQIHSYNNGLAVTEENNANIIYFRGGDILEASYWQADSSYSSYPFNIAISGVMDNYLIFVSENTLYRTLDGNNYEKVDVNFQPVSLEYIPCLIEENNIYLYDQTLTKYTVKWTNVGEDHPDYLSAVYNTGIYRGSDLIADKTNKATGEGSLAIEGDTRQEVNSTAVGSNSMAFGENSTAIGQEAAVYGSNSTSIGKGAVAEGDGAIAIGCNASAVDKVLSVGFGYVDGDPEMGSLTYNVLNGNTGKFYLGRMPYTAGNNINISNTGVISANVNIAVDNSTISKNPSDELQATAIINSSNSSALPIWQGTEGTWAIGGGLKDTFYGWMGEANWIETTLTSSSDWSSITYGDGKFVTVSANNSNKTAYSTDGINWTESTLPSSAYWNSVTYGDGKFVTVSTTNNSNKTAYSTDGINWTASTLPSSAYWESVTYGDGKFVVVAANNSNKTAYSTDGINWTESTLPISTSWGSITYGDGKFVVVARDSNKFAYSTNGINWTEITSPSSSNWSSMTYGDGKFVAVTRYSNKSAYSTDGINWTETTLPNSLNWSSITYGDGKFVVVAKNSNKFAYSTNGINWTETTLPSTTYWSSVTYGDGKFVAVSANNSNKTAYLPSKNPSCFTLDVNPTTSTIVYDAPDTTSTLTITSVGTGTITLSDGNTYTYDDTINQFTYHTVGETYPNYLCNINGVGVKIGDTFIANNTQVDQTYDASSTNPQSGIAISEVLGDIETLINAL